MYSMPPITDGILLLLLLLSLLFFLFCTFQGFPSFLTFYLNLVFPLVDSWLFSFYIYSLRDLSLVPILW